MARTYKRIDSDGHILEPITLWNDYMDPAFRERYVTKQWYEAVGNTPEQFAEFLKTDYERWEKLIRLSGVTVE